MPHVEIDDIYIGNGVSELIVMAMQGLLNNGDEILVPAPDYPLWTAAITLCGGKAVHYRCDEQADWQPDIDDMKRKVTSRTRGIVVINPNNPTGAVYSREMLERHRRDRAAEGSDPVRRRNLRQDHLRRRGAHTARVARTRSARADVQRSVEDVSRRRIPHRLDGDCPAPSTAPPTTSRG